MRLPRRPRARAAAPTQRSSAHWRQWVGDRPPLELLPSGEGRVESLLEFVWSVPRSEADFVNVVVPELFHRRSLLEAAPQADLASSSSCACSRSRAS